MYADVGGTNTRVWTEGTGKIQQLIIGLRGVWTPKEKAVWKKKLRGISPKITVLSDIELAHLLAFGNEPGIVLNAGTGSIAFGRTAHGKNARAGGLGPLIGDEGSAFWIGKEYLRLRLERGADGEKIRRYVVGKNPVATIAGLAKKVLAAAQKRGSSAEARIVTEAQNHLKKLVKEVREKLELPASTPVYMTGGLFENRFFKRRWQTSLSRP